MKHIHSYILLLLLPILSCNSEKELVDAYGNFEAIEVILSTETAGLIKNFPLREGDRLKKNQVVVSIDTVQLLLQKKQLQSGKSSLSARLFTLDAQIKASRVQMENLQREKKRIDRLF